MSESRVVRHRLSLSIGTTTAEEWSTYWATLNEIAATFRDAEPVDVVVSSTLVDDYIEEIPDEVFDEGTLLRVFQALRGESMTEKAANSAINAMQNAGILFRERRAQS
jgi:hypothetical protein